MYCRRSIPIISAYLGVVKDKTVLCPPIIRNLSKITTICARYQGMSQQKSHFVYPPVKRENLKEVKFNVTVPDPYRYLEDPDAEETKKFVDAQNAITTPYLELCPHRQKIKEILTKNQDYPRQGCLFKRGDKYYFFKNSGLQPQAVLYQLDSLDSEPKLFYDPNKLSEDGTIALSQTAFSPNGQYFAFALSKSGSDWVEIGIIDNQTGNELPERLSRAKFTSISWTHDNQGFFYTMYPSHKGAAEGTSTDRNEFHSIYYHRLSTPQSDDILKVDFPDKAKWRCGCEVSDDGKYLHVYVREGCNDTLWYYCKLGDFSVSEKLTLKPIYDKLEAEFDYITNNGDVVYFKTNLDAKNYRICKLDLTKPAKENWIDVVANDPNDLLSWGEVFSVAGMDYILLNFTRKVVSELELRYLEGKTIKKFDLPPGTIMKIPGRREHDEFFFQFTSFLSPGQVYHFDLKDLTKEAHLIKQSKPSGFNPDDYMIEQVFYKSKDQTEIPMFLIHRKDLVKDGKNPCILYGYGGFNISITSGFNINRVAWYKHFKGVLAVANIRGGGELGQDWHNSGRLLKKQNCFTDFASAAEFLIENKYTRPDKLAIEGGSNGGLLVAACSNQRPDLFGATVCHVGVLDMIRFTKFTVGDAWTCDYGDPEEEEHFKNLINYSPYHNIPDDVERYPSTLLLTADHDDRVVPAHSLKFIAELQHKLGKRLPETPLIIRVDTKAGHGAGKPTSKVIDEYADIYSFLYNALDLEQYFTE